MIESHWLHLEVQGVVIEVVSEIAIVRSTIRVLKSPLITSPGPPSTVKESSWVNHKHLAKMLGKDWGCAMADCQQHVSWRFEQTCSGFQSFARFMAAGS